MLNTKPSERAEFPDYLKKFEYVNGGLFADNYKSPKFSPRSRKILIECGELDWSEINPDIFGSMIQAVVHPDQRGGMGMHYTSVSNIMKVIEPLFLNELHEEFANNQHNPQKLEKLLSRLSTLRIFDPACGSGNFLIIAYKELRILEMKILKQLKALSDAARGLDDVQASLIPKAQMSLASSFAPQLFSRIHLAQFFGIELDDFAHEIAILSLWLAEHQMNIRFNDEFHKKLPSLPLKQGGKIICDNATRIPWEDVCPKDDKAEIYILGNPPYLGAKELNEIQRLDMIHTFKELGSVKRMDYIGCWFKKGADYIKNNFAKYAFVSTDSICQGEQVSLLWPYIFAQKLEISFAYKSFKWSNNAKNNAGVTCVIVGIQNEKKSELKHLYTETSKKLVFSISPYLIEGNPIYMEQRNSSISNLPKMILGSSGFDGGYLMLTPDEKNKFIIANANSEKFIRRFMSGDDFLNSNERYCLWIRDNEVEQANDIFEIKERIDKCRKFRLTGGRDAKKAALVPHRFFYPTHRDTNSIIFPKTTSGRRVYVPAGFLTPDIIVSNASFIIYDASPYIFGLLSSKLHCVWLSVTSARMNTSYRYSVNLTYNNFPVPELSEKQKETITTHVLNVLEERENHSEKTLAELYDPEKMPKGLREAHEGLDQAIERCYRQKPFTSDEERLEYLFKLYEEMTAQEQSEKK